MGGGWSAPRPGRCIPVKEKRYPLYRKLAGPRNQSERIPKISPHTGVRIPDGPALNDSLCRLRYGHHLYEEDVVAVCWLLCSFRRKRGKTELLDFWRFPRKRRGRENFALFFVNLKDDRQTFFKHMRMNLIGYIQLWYKSVHEER